MPKKKILKKKKTHRRKTSKKGGAITDYIPSTDTVASYIPYGRAALKNYRDVRNLYNKGKKAFEIYQGVINPRQPPPLPPGGPPTDRRSLAQSRRDIAFNRMVDESMPDPMHDSKRMLEMMNAQRVKYPGRLENKSDLITKLREIKPISFIDNTLNSLGQRDCVQNYLSQSEIGKHLVTGADLAIQHGFGARPHIAKSGHGRGSVRERGKKRYSSILV